MNFSDIRFFLENQLKSAESAADSPKAGDLLLLMVDFLLEQVEKDPKAFTQNSGKELRNEFRRCSSITRRIRGFADAYKTPVEEEAEKALNTINENASVLAQLEADCNRMEEYALGLHEQAEKIKAKHAQVEQDHQDVLQQETELRNRKEKFDALTANVDECREIMTQITDEVIAALQKELSEIKADASIRKEQHIQLQQQKHQAMTENEQLITEIKAMTMEIKTLEEETIPQDKEELQKKKDAYSNAVKQAKELSDAIVEADNQHEELRALLEENQKIADSIIRDGFVLDDREAEHSFYVQLERIKDRAEQVSEEYNQLLSAVLQDAREMYQKLLNRQEPGYKCSKA